MTPTSDILGETYSRTDHDLGPDPDGEGHAFASLVSHTPSQEHEHALLFVHGMSDYFFQDHVAQHFAKQGYAVYAIDLRKCGRAHRPGQRWHHASDMRVYFPDLDWALETIEERHRTVTVVGHSTGGLIVPLWAATRGQRIRALILNSPWLDLQIGQAKRRFMVPFVHLMARIAPTAEVPGGLGGYGESLHRDYHGEWDFDLTWKPIAGHPKNFRWLDAVLRGQEQIHRSEVECPMPILVLCSTESWLGKPYSAATDTADAVLDVADMLRWAPKLGPDVTVKQIEGARHDVFLSLPHARNVAFATCDQFLDDLPQRSTNG